jgi:type VI secretion system secreted protein Hcp
MAFDAFLWFEGGGEYKPEGESQDNAFSGVKAFEIKSFRFGAKNKATIGSTTGGAGAGKAEFEVFEITKDTDYGSPKLFGACVAGAHFNKACLAIRKSGGHQRETQGKKVSSVNDAEAQAYLIYSFHFVYVNEIQWSGRSGDDVPEETVRFAYGAMKIHYRRQDQKGNLIGTPSIQAWSQVLNQPTETVM